MGICQQSPGSCLVLSLAAAAPPWLWSCCSLPSLSTFICSGVSSGGGWSLWAFVLGLDVGRLALLPQHSQGEDLLTPVRPVSPLQGYLVISRAWQDWDYGV